MVSNVRSGLLSPTSNSKAMINLSIPDCNSDAENVIEANQGGPANQVGLFGLARKQIFNSAGKILIVDDEKFNCDIIDGFLMILGV